MSDEEEEPVDERPASQPIEESIPDDPSEAEESEIEETVPDTHEDESDEGEGGEEEEEDDNSGVIPIIARKKTTLRPPRQSIIAEQVKPQKPRTPLPALLNAPHPSEKKSVLVPKAMPNS